MRFGNAVEAPDPQMLDFSVLQKCITGFGADPQYLAHLFDIQDIRVIPKHECDTKSRNVLRVNATLSIWSNPTVTCTGQKPALGSSQDNMGNLPA